MEARTQEISIERSRPVSSCRVLGGVVTGALVVALENSAGQTTKRKAQRATADTRVITTGRAVTLVGGEEL